MIKCAPTKPNIYRKFRIGHPTIWSYLINKAQVNSNSLIVDIGCGPGVEAAALECVRTGLYVGIDHAIDAIVSGHLDFKQKQHIQFMCADSVEIPLGNEIAKLVTFMVSLHQMINPTASLNEAIRVVKPDGLVAIVVVPHDQWINACEFRFFPELMNLDLERRPIQKLDYLTTLSKKMLANVQITQMTYLNRKIDQKVIDAIEQKHFSALQLLDEESFDQGLRRLKNFVQETNEQHLEHIDCFVLTGRKQI